MKSPKFLLALLVSLSTPVFSAEQPAARVRVAEVSEQQLAQTVRAIGVIDFARVASVSPEVSGVVASLNLAEGKHVKQGDVLVELDDGFLKKDIDIRQREVEQVDAEIARERANLKRLESLLKSSSASRGAYEDSMYTVQAQEKRRDTLKEQISRLRLSLEKSRIRAPFDGVVLEKLAERGEWVGPQTPVGRIAATAELRVRASVGQDLARFQTVGMSVPVEIEALGETVEGKISSLDPVVDLRSQNITVNVGLTYHEGLLQNMRATTQLPAAEQQTLRLVPRDALIRFQGKDFVYAVVDDVAKIMPVNIVARLKENVGVDGDIIQPGMRVVIDGNDRLRPDTPVSVIEE
jgi:RND family efflux transporter MFP subunit